MRLLLDADAASKLAHWGLLDELPDLFSVSWSDVATLESVTYRAEAAANGKPNRLFPSLEIAKYASKCTQQMGSLPSIPQRFVAMLQNVALIDGGEAVLFAASAAHPETFVITGDKRAMAALGKHVRAVGTNELNRRCISLELIVLRLLFVRGIDWLRQKICPHRELDKAIAVAMGSRCDAPAADVEAGLRSYLSTLVTEGDPVVQGL